MQAIHRRSNCVIGLRDYLKEETAATAATVAPGQLADRRRSKPGRCSLGISVVRCPQNFLSCDLSGPAELLPLPRKAMTRIKRRPFSRARNARGAPLDSCPTNRV